MAEVAWVVLGWDVSLGVFCGLNRRCPSSGRGWGVCKNVEREWILATVVRLRGGSIVPCHEMGSSAQVGEVKCLQLRGNNSTDFTKQYVQKTGGPIAAVKNDSLLYLRGSLLAILAPNSD